MIVNPYVENAIIEYIVNYLSDIESCTLWSLLQNYSNKEIATESEIRTVVYKLIDEGCLQLLNGKRTSDDSVVKLARYPIFKKIENEIKIVVSKPNLREISIQDIEDRNHQINSIECFRVIISSAKNTLRICSPFIQHNVLNIDAFPDLRKLLADALNRGVEVKLLTRELNERNEEVQWLVEVANKIDKRSDLSIVDYHLQEKDGSILSSTHAKILIADYDVAYIGSAELRKNSLIKNLEIGCMIRGSSVFGICEVFDFMFSQGDLFQ